jgi:ankyrin repeat protein
MGYSKIVRLLLELEEVDIHARDKVWWTVTISLMSIMVLFKKGWTPLHYASWNGFDEVVFLLVNSGVDVNAPNEVSNSPP